MDKVFEHDQVFMSYHAEKQLLIQIWTGFIQEHIFRQAIDTTLRLSRTRSIRFILSDTVHQEVIKQEDAKYAAAIMPELIKNGLRAMAFVVPRSIFTQMALNKFRKETPSDIIRYFEKKEEAEKWLEELHNLSYTSQVQ